MPLDLGVTVEVKGLQELKARLDALPKEVAQRGLRRAVAAGASVIRAAAKKAAPVAAGPIRRGGGKETAPGTLQRGAMAKFIKAESNDTQVFYIVGFRQGKRQQKSNRDAFYASWVEFGHKIVPRRGKGARKGTLARNRRQATASVPPHPYFAPAWEANKQNALDAIQKRLTSELQKLGA